MKDLKCKVDEIDDVVSDIKVDVAVIKTQQKPMSKLTDNIEQINITLTKNTATLDEHIRRTEASEKRLDHVENNQEHIMNNINNTNIEIKEHLSFINGAIKSISVLTAVVTLLYKLGLF